ncbi:MAG: elongation factor P [Candidatus Pelagibacterales bacterium]|jgi:elongation factor P|tara:strand:- start:218 stop:781 length:564 start_codon:yes stop_codon:yes gene_type:complete
MKINGNSVKPGMIVEHKNDLWVVTKSQSVKPGKGGAFNQVEMKSLKNGSKLNERFRASEEVERVRVDEEKFQYLYQQENKLIFMNLTDYEQMELDVEFIGDKIDLLRENDEVILEMYDEKPIGIQLPNTLIFEVSETEAVVKGQTAASSNKPAVLENGLRVMVPPFIEQGEKVIINTEDLTYLKRAE